MRVKRFESKVNEFRAKIIAEAAESSGCMSNDTMEAMLLVNELLNSLITVNQEVEELKEKVEKLERSQKVES